MRVGGWRGEGERGRRRLDDTRVEDTGDAENLIAVERGGKVLELSSYDDTPDFREHQGAVREKVHPS